MSKCVDFFRVEQGRRKTLFLVGGRRVVDLYLYVVYRLIRNDSS